MDFDLLLTNLVHPNVYYARAYAITSNKQVFYGNQINFTVGYFSFCYGGSGEDESNSIQQTTDGGYIVAGYTGSLTDDVVGIHGFYDMWIVKLNSDGEIEK